MIPFALFNAENQPLTLYQAVLKISLKKVNVQRPNRYVHIVRAPLKRPLEQETQVEIFCLTPVGIMGAGIQSHWSEIVGFYYDDESWEIILRNYSGRGMRFGRGLFCIMVIAGNEALTTQTQGYPIPMCVMNRIAFKQQRGIDE